MGKHGYWLGAMCAIAIAGGCRDEGAPVAGTTSTTTARDQSAACVEFQGLRHCRLGNATLTPHEEGRVVEVTNLSDADRDGITVQLPDVTNFAPEGRIDGTAPGSRMNVRAMSGGNTIGTMSLQRTLDGYQVAAAFTGEGNEGTYRALLYRGEALVGSIGGIPNGEPVFLPRFVSLWRYWWIWWYFVSFWNVMHADPSTGDEPGACVFELPLAAGDEVQVQSDEGEVVVADRIELHENVQRGGSYPYLSFDRMDYTIGGGRMLLTGETIDNRPE